MKRTLTVALTAIIAALVIAPQAEAAKLKPAKFKIEAEGEQLTIWRYEKVVGGCDFPDNEEGRQYLTFEGGGKSAPTVRASAIKGGGVRLNYLDDEEALFSYAEASLLRNYEVLYSQMTPCPGGGPYGGGDPPQDAVGTDTCDVEGQVEGFISAEYTDVANLSYPTELETKPEPKASIYFAADGLWGSPESLAAYCAETGQDGAQYGLADGQGEYPGNILPVAGSLPAKQLLNPKNKRTTVHLGRTVRYPNEIQSYVGGPVSAGKTRVDVTLTFIRIR